MKPLALDPQQCQDLERRRKHTSDKRVYQRLTAVLLAADGRTRPEVAHLLGISVRKLSDWLRLFRNRGADALCTLHYRGHPGKLTPAQAEQLRQEICTGRFHNSDQIRLWLEETFRVAYTRSGVKGLLHRLGASYHQVTGFLWK